MSIATIDWILFFGGVILFCIGGWGLTAYSRRWHKNSPTPLGCTLEIIGALMIVASIFIAVNIKLF